MKEIRKITFGFVTQRFDAKTNRFLGQEFTDSDHFDYEDENGNAIDEQEVEYVSYEMKQGDDAKG